MIDAAAAVVVLLLSIAACASPQWIVRHTNCTTPPTHALGTNLVYCSDDALPVQWCLYEREQDCPTVDGPGAVRCRVHMVRETCGGEWVELADDCLITREPPDGAEPEEMEEL
jgi:hypothetical protein